MMTISAYSIPKVTLTGGAAQAPRMASSVSSKVNAYLDRVELSTGGKALSKLNESEIQNQKAADPKLDLMLQLLERLAKEKIQITDVASFRAELEAQAQKMLEQRATMFPALDEPTWVMKTPTQESAPIFSMPETKDSTTEKIGRTTDPAPILASYGGGAHTPSPGAVLDLVA